MSNIDTLNVWFVNQENAKVSGITSGNLDYTQSLRSDMVPMVENLEGVEVISLPLYMSDSGLPIGVEIDGAIDQDELVLQLSAQLERAAPWSERKPPIYVSEI